MQISTGELPGSDRRPSEDRIVHDAGLGTVVVLDGVSTVSDDTPRGGWYAQTLGKEILAELRRDPHLTLSAALHAALTTVTTEHGLVAGASPAATVAIVRHRAAVHMVDALVLADTPVIAVHRDGRAEALRDDRLERLVRTAPEWQQFEKQLCGGCGFGAPEHQELTVQLRGHQMQHINKFDDPWAYWVAEATPTAAHQAVVRSWPVADLDHLLVLTDGVSAAVDSYGLWPSWAEMASAVAAGEPQKVVEAIHAYEHEQDPHGIRHPRYKISDDKALASISFAAIRQSGCGSPSCPAEEA
ncbi:protein phosphatase 2C domain-containing protein [Streptomyces sp. NPDC050161]|uniref:protein phosphatase 2C domain-containing protein n=1 Tax=Streptomyces sp. NPDC050161 TaxID=3365604 RepID=UPI00378E1B40